jgi:hypothetical protein
MYERRSAGHASGSRYVVQEPGEELVSRAALVLAISTLLLASGCGGDTDQPDAADNADNAGNAQSISTASASPTPEETGPAYQVLDKPDLQAALLGIQDLPAGYSQDPPSEPTNKTFCDYKMPVEENALVRQDFTKGGGMSAELASVSLRQFDSPEDASKAFDALTNALETCHGDDIDGTHADYTPMSAPKVGDASVGVRIEADNFTLMQNFVLVGPTIVTTGGGGLMNANADQVTQLVEAQVKAYQDAAAS